MNTIDGDILKIIHDLYDEPKWIPPQPTHKHSPVLDGGYYICSSCGLVLEQELIFDITIRPTVFTDKAYKRKVYFKEKLRLLACLNNTRHSSYIKVLDMLAKSKKIIKIQNALLGKSKDEIARMFIFKRYISKIKTVLRKMNKSSFYKYLYNFIYDLFEFKCFDMRDSDVLRLATIWINIENKFIKKYPTKHNMLSYNTIFYFLLKREGIKYTELIILPRNFDMIVQLLENII